MRNACPELFFTGLSYSGKRKDLSHGLESDFSSSFFSLAFSTSCCRSCSRNCSTIFCDSSNCFFRSSAFDVTTIVFVTFAVVVWAGRTTKPGFDVVDSVALDDVTSVAVVGFFGWMEMDGFTRTILTVRFSLCDCDKSAVVTILRFSAAEVAADWSWGSVVSFAGLPGKNTKNFNVSSDFTRRYFKTYPGAQHFSELPLKAMWPKGVTTQGQAG